jgi:hypothetical protein
MGPAMANSQSHLYCAIGRGEICIKHNFKSVPAPDAPESKETQLPLHDIQFLNPVQISISNAIPLDWGNILI